MARTFVRRNSREGSALVTVMVPLLGALVLGYAFFRSTLAEQASAHGDLDERQAFFLAEAGLHEAFASVRQGNSGGVATPDQPAQLGGGVLWVEATDLGNDQ